MFKLILIRKFSQYPYSKTNFLNIHRFHQILLLANTTSFVFDLIRMKLLFNHWIECIEVEEKFNEKKLLQAKFHVVSFLL